jgi:hypothetical protein
LPDTPGAAAGISDARLLTAGHRRAKTVTNCVANRFGDGSDTPRIRARVGGYHDTAAAELVDGLDDDTIARAITAVRDLLRRLAQVSPGGTLWLSRPPRPGGRR